MPQIILIPTFNADDNSDLMMAYSSVAGPLTEELKIPLDRKKYPSQLLDLGFRNLTNPGKDAVDRVRLFVNDYLKKYSGWIEEQRLYAVGSSSEGDSIKLGLAMALLLHNRENSGVGIIATGDLGGLDADVSILPISRLEEKFAHVLKERNEGKLKLDSYVFFVPAKYIDKNGITHDTTDLQDQINKFSAPGVNIKIQPISRLIEIFNYLNIAPPEYVNPNHQQAISTTKPLFSIKKIIFGLLATLAITALASTIKVDRHHKIAEFDQLTREPLIDFNQLAEKVKSFQYQKPLSVMVVYSEKAPYEQAIVNAFLEHLENKVSNLDRPEIGPIYDIYGNLTTPDGNRFKEDGKTLKSEDEIKAEWITYIQRITARTTTKKVDYFVTLGTFVTKMIRDAKLIEKFEAETKVKPKGIVFLGVTDPKKRELVKAYKNRKEATDITGVRYGSDQEEDYGNTISSIFPSNQKLVFVYDSLRYPQDGYVAENLEKLNKTLNHERFELRNKAKDDNGDGESDVFISLDDLKPKHPDDPKEVYFAWYGLDNILRDSTKDVGLSALKDKWVVPSTYSTDNLDKAGVIVSVSDQEVGKVGADIVFESYLNPDLKLGNMDIGTPDFLIWLDCSVIRHNKAGLRLASPLPKTTLTLHDEDCPYVM